MQLTPVQVRILGCLIEKERTTPDNYPLTMNSLLAACNQTTNRYPVVTFTEPTVSNALLNLRSQNLLRIDHSRSNRADKYRHVLGSELELDDAEIALLAVLMLRGPQTSAELRTRSERMHAFPDQGVEPAPAGPDMVDAVLARLAARPQPLVTRLAPRPGQKEARWAHLMSGDVSPEDIPAPAPSPASQSRTERIEALEAAVQELQSEVAQLKSRLDDLGA